LSEKLLAKAKRHEFKDLLLGKLSTLKEDNKFDEVSVIEKKMVRTIKLNEIANTGLIFSIDVKAGYGKISFNIVKGFKSKELGRSSRTIMNLYLSLLWSS
jgi:hypothetical protein